MSAAEELHERLIDQLIGRGALWSKPLRAAFRATPRHLFLDRFFLSSDGGGWREYSNARPEDLPSVYADRAVTTRLSEPREGRSPVPISSSSQPSLMAQMLEDLPLGSGQRVLEVGAGTGYNAALLAHVTGGVVSQDVDREVLAGAAAHLRALPDRRVELVHGDGRQGWPPSAPYDRIQVTAATPDLEPAWLAQLADGGLVQAPLELAPGLAFIVQGEVRGGCFRGRLTRPAYFMPLREEGSAGRGDPDGAGFPDPHGLATAPAPWADWEERRTAGSGASVAASLAFLGLLQGWAVSHQAVFAGRQVYAVADLVRGHACWFGPREWRVTGPEGERLGRELWRLFLDTGGPRPTEFRLTARPPDAGPVLVPAADATLSFVRRGPRTVQIWELFEPRDRGGWL